MKIIAFRNTSSCVFHSLQSPPMFSTPACSASAMSLMRETIPVSVSVLSLFFGQLLTRECSEAFEGSKGIPGLAV